MRECSGSTPTPTAGTGISTFLLFIEMNGKNPGQNMVMRFRPRHAAVRFRCRFGGASSTARRDLDRRPRPTSVAAIGAVDGRHALVEGSFATITIDPGSAARLGSVREHQRGDNYGVVVSRAPQRQACIRWYS